MGLVVRRADARLDTWPVLAGETPFLLRSGALTTVLIDNAAPEQFEAINAIYGHSPTAPVAGARPVPAPRTAVPSS